MSLSESKNPIPSIAHCSLKLNHNNNKNRNQNLTLVANLKSHFFHNPLLTNRSHSQSLLITAKTNPIAVSATSSVKTSGVLVTLIPFCWHFLRSILSNPTLKLETISSLGNESMSSASAPILVSPTIALMEWELFLKKSVFEE